MKLIIDDGRRDEFEGKMIGRPAKLKIFRNRGWLAEREISTSREVGVYKIYSLKIPFENIIAEIEGQVKENWIKKQATIRQLGEENEDIEDSLISLGESRPMARVLSYLKNKNNVSAGELEREARLRQPEVSIALKRLKKRHWITNLKEKRHGKGRPHRIYSLKISFYDIIAQLEEQQKEEVDEMHESIKRLKELQPSK